jgi:hypothetical protein
VSIQASLEIVTGGFGRFLSVIDVAMYLGQSPSWAHFQQYSLPDSELSNFDLRNVELSPSEWTEKLHPNDRGKEDGIHDDFSFDTALEEKSSRRG